MTYYNINVFASLEKRLPLCFVVRDEKVLRHSRAAF